MTSMIYKNEFYTIKLNKKFVFLLYEYRYPGSTYKKILGRVSGWRRNMFLEAVRAFKASHEEWEFVPAMKMRLYINILPFLKSQLEAENVAEILEKMPFEELTFWNWKFNSMKKGAVRGFKAMYLKGDKPWQHC